MAGELRAPLVTVDPLAEGTPNIRTPLVTVDPLTEGNPSLLASFVVVDPLSEGYASIRQSLFTVDALTEGYRNLRMSLFLVEALVPIYPEEYMSTKRFPGSLDSGSVLPGLSFEWHKRPGFRTNSNSAASGVSHRNAMMEFPIWQFEGNFEFLRDIDSINNNEFKTILGFFCARKGRFDEFLFKDSDDYLVINGASYVPADGVTTQFPFTRAIGDEFKEKVGQVDTDNTVAVYNTVTQSGLTIPGVGPYTLTPTHAADFVEDLGVTKAGVPMVKALGAPAAGEYSVNVGTGVYTFNAANAGQGSVAITYRYDFAPADYTVTMPNLLVFDSAPPTGTISMDFEFFFRCIFKEDMADFQKFADKFWDLQTIEFESVPA